MNIHLHLECVQLLLDLLGQERSQSVASSDLSTTIVFTTRPGIMESDTRAKADVVLGRSVGRGGCTVGVSGVDLRRRSKISFLVLAGEGSVAARPLVLVSRDVGNLRKDVSRFRDRGG